MGPGRRDQQGTLGGKLALHLVEVGVGLAVQDQAVGLVGFEGLLAVEVRDQFQQVVYGVHHQARSQAGLLGILPWHHQGAPGFAGGKGGRQHALHAAHRPRQRQLAQAFHCVQRGDRHLPVGGQDAQGYGQVEASAILGQVGGGEVEGDAPRGELQAGVEDGAAHTVLAFLYRGFGQADQGQVGQAVGQVRFDGDRRGQYAHLGAAVDKGEGHAHSMIGTMPRPAAGARIVVRAQGARGRVSRGFAAVDGARSAGQDHGAPVQPSGRDGVRANGFYRRLGVGGGGAVGGGGCAV